MAELWDNRDKLVKRDKKTKIAHNPDPSGSTFQTLASNFEDEGKKNKHTLRK